MLGCSSSPLEQLVEIKIVRQPNSVYRMRYKTDPRQTNLFANELISNDSSDDTSSVENSLQPTTSNQFSKKSKKKVPKIKILNATGPAFIKVSCVCAESNHIHPNFLVGKYCTNGIANIPIGPGENHAELNDIRIELIKRSDIETRIEKLKTEIKHDPFQVGYEFDYKNIDVGQLRLCFQLDILNNQSLEIKPIVSQVISTNKQKFSIIIQKIINLKSTVSGGDDVVIFVKKLEKDQKPLFAKFFDEFGWTQLIEIKDIHYRCAMVFKAPEYKNNSIETGIKVFLQLICPFEKKPLIISSDSSSHKYESEIKEFIYEPAVENHDIKKRKFKSIKENCNEFMNLEENVSNIDDISYIESIFNI